LLLFFVCPWPGIAGKHLYGINMKKSLLVLFLPLFLLGRPVFLPAAEEGGVSAPVRMGDPAAQLIGSPEEADAPADDEAAQLLRQARLAYGQRDQREKIVECVELLRAALALAPEDEERNLRFAAAVTWFQGYHSRGKYEEKLIKMALNSIQQVLEHDPDNPLAHYLHGMLNAFMGRALSSLRSFSYFGYMEQELGWVMEHYPGLDYAGAYRAMGRYLAQMPALLGGDTAKAIDYYLQASHLAPEYLLNYLLLAELFIKTEQYEPAQGLLLKVLKSPAPPPELEPEWRMWKVRAQRVWESLQQNQYRDEEY
jgi:tetratricopeptide (TPR) repeat protein